MLAVLWMALSWVSLGQAWAGTSLPPLLHEVEAKYKAAATLSADFQQINDNKLLSKKKKTSGKIFVKRPSKIRWETSAPDASLLVNDGKKIWFYTPPFEEGERGQVVLKDVSQVQSQLASALLSGAFSVAKNMTIRQESPSLFLLTPKAGTAGTVSQATLQIDSERKLITQVILLHKGGNRTEISLTQIDLGPTLKEDLFQFKTPPHTDLIQEDSK